jgi:hypothetical protein
VDQLVEIIKVLGTPSREEIHNMNPNYTEFKFPQIKAHPWSKVFSKRMPADAINLVNPQLSHIKGVYMKTCVKGESCVMFLSRHTYIHSVQQSGPERHPSMPTSCVNPFYGVLQSDSLSGRVEGACCNHMNCVTMLADL